MPAALSLLKELRAHLIEHGLVRAPGAPGVLPVCELPRGETDGHRLPDGEDVLVLLALGVRIPNGQPFIDAFLERRSVDVIVRSRHPRPGEELQRDIARLLAERRGTTFGVLRIEWCRLWRGDQETGSTAGLLERTQSFDIAVRFRALDGTPDTP